MTSANARQPWGRTGLAILLLALVVGGGLRLWDLGGPSFSDDEIFKVRAVQSYRANKWTLTGDEEHPLGMKLLIFAAWGARDVWNDHVVGEQPSPLRMSVETATRLPNALGGTFMILLLALLAREAFSRRVGLIVACLYAVEATAIGYCRIAKEDTFLAFFLALTLYFVLRAKNTAEQGDRPRSRRYELYAAAGLGLMFTVKYFLHLAFIPLIFYAWSRRAGTTWEVSWRRWLALIGVALLVFLAVNPTVLHPDNLRYMTEYAQERFVYHTGYVFRGGVYDNRVFVGATRSPWYLYFGYLFYKLSLPVLLAVAIGLGKALWRGRSDGARLVLTWVAVWLLIHAILAGAKWGRFVMHILPAVLLFAAVGLDAAAGWCARWLKSRPALASGSAALMLVGAVAPSVYASVMAAPHYRFQLNMLAGGREQVRFHLPHCDIFDVGLREAVQYICARAEPNAQLRAEPIAAVKYYLESCARPDILATTMSKPTDVCAPERPCYHLLQEGRFAWQVQPTAATLHAARPPDAIVVASDVQVAEVYGPAQKPGDGSTSTPVDAVRLAPFARVIDAARAPRPNVAGALADAPWSGRGTDSRPGARVRVLQFPSGVLVEEALPTGVAASP